MQLTRQIEQLARRAERITILQRPPALEMVVLQPSEEIPPANPLFSHPKRAIEELAFCRGDWTGPISLSIRT
jgi:hypothetical protein